MEFLRQLFSSNGFMPHGHCYLWNPGVVWLHVIADSLIALAYYSIPFTLVYFVRKRKDLVFHWMFLCFAVFIVACGTTHLMEIWNIWQPTYWLSGVVKGLTALASLPTAVLLIGLVPKALALPSPAQLAAANQALKNEIAERTQTEAKLRESEERFRLLVSRVKDYAIFGLDPRGCVESWNEGAERIKGYQASGILGQSIATFYTPEDQARGWPQHLLAEATEHGHVEEEGWRVRKDGTRFWANVVITALRNAPGQLRGFAKVTRDATERKRAEEDLRESKQALLDRTVQLEAANRELEAFSFSVSHDLRAPVRAIDGFSQALLEDCGALLNGAGKGHLTRIREATRRMGQLIDGLLELSRYTRGGVRRESVELDAHAEAILDDLKRSDPTHQVDVIIERGLTACGDSRLLRVALENLLRNAWKFSRKKARAQIELGQREHQGQRAFFVRDNGAGFDMTYSQRLFGAFQRLHPRTEFEGTGIGLATVQRIIHRHGGRIWAESAPEQGATFFFTLPSP